jgi:hypothetical protein
MGAGERALGGGDIVAKFLANATLTIGGQRARQALDAVLDESPRPVRAVLRAFCP